jgi:hypothetical protein
VPLRYDVGPIYNYIFTPLYLICVIHIFQRIDNIRRNHLANRGNGSSIWPGIKKWSRNEMDAMKDTYCGKRTRNTVVKLNLYIY